MTQPKAPSRPMFCQEWCVVSHGRPPSGNAMAQDFVAPKENILQGDDDVLGQSDEVAE